MFNENWAFDVLAALPFKHDIKATIKSPIPDTPDFTTATAKIADTKQLPPTFSVQYHFAPDSDFQPYVGVGLNWTTFSSTKFVPELDDLIGEEISKLVLDDSYGAALQLGGDWKLGDHALLNVDIRWIDIDSDVSVTGPGFDGKQKLFTAEIDPWVYALNLGYQF
jgi:outer membrane protein